MRIVVIDEYGSNTAESAAFKDYVRNAATWLHPAATLAVAV